MAKVASTETHSAAWIAQTWISFVIATVTTSAGILYLPVVIWVKAFLGMGLLFTVGSTISLSKTLRDQHEALKIHQRVDEARMERLLVEHDALK